MLNEASGLQGSKLLILPAFNDTIAVALPPYACSAVAGAAIQATLSSATVRYARSAIRFSPYC